MAVTNPVVMHQLGVGMVEMAEMEHLTLAMRVVFLVVVVVAQSAAAVPL